MPDGGSITERKPNPAYRVWSNIPTEDRNQRLQTVLQRICNDERTADIARDYGISQTALNMVLLQYAEDDWRTAQVARAISRVARAQDERESVDVTSTGAALRIARARDDEKSAQWELERLLSRLYGRAEVAVQVTVPSDAALDGSAGALLVRIAQKSGNER